MLGTWFQNQHFYTFICLNISCLINLRNQNKKSKHYTDTDLNNLFRLLCKKWKQGIQQLAFNPFQNFCTRWTGLVRQVNSHLVRKCTFASWYWQETSFQLLGGSSWRGLGRWPPYRSVMKAMAKKLKTKFSVWDKRKGICWNLSPASFNWLTNILTQGETSPALPALVILDKKSRMYEIPVPKF